jgi:hypothetical protein
MYVNRRHDNHREDLFRYCVSRFTHLRDVIVPFFVENPLRTSKRKNFEKFAAVIDVMTRKGTERYPGSSRSLRSRKR